jgi:hypothetical protein
MSLPPQQKINIDPLSVTSLFLKTFVDQVPISTATGFVIRKADRYYLVTNRHVATGRDQTSNQPLHSGGAVPTHIEILHHVVGQLGTWRPIRETLYSQGTGAPRWAEHPRYGSRVDVVVLPLEVTAGLDFFGLDLNLRTADLLVGPAEPVSIVGFPLGQTAAAGLAIWKSGTIASDLDVDYNNLPIFLIDAVTRPSMSGSPVYARRVGSHIRATGGVTVGGGVMLKFLGVYSGRIIREEAEIGMVWKASALCDIVEGMP